MHGTALAIQKMSRVRRELSRKNLLFFALSYLPAHFKDPPSSMHRELFQMLEAAHQTRGQRLAIAAPRGHAKSTIVSQAYVLWCICYGYEQFILLISNTSDQASDGLSMIKHELQTNQRLLDDFPEACELPGNMSGAPRWRKEEIITRNGVKVTALGAEKKVRGRKHNQYRPSLMILDDIENETEVRSAEQRSNKQEWFNKAVLKAGSAGTNVIVVGTILHYDSLLSGLTDSRKSPGWTGRKYKAVRQFSSRPELWEQWQAIYSHRQEHEGKSGPGAAKAYFESFSEGMLEGTDVLWPQRESYLHLMELRFVEGRASFDSEKQNEPIDPDDCYFQENEICFWEDKFQTVEELISTMGGVGGHNAQLLGACDPSLGKAGRFGKADGDYSAIIGLLRNRKTNVLYVVDADIRRRKPDELISTIINYQRLRRFSAFGIEANQFQQFLADEVRRQSAAGGTRVPVVNINHTTDKLGRIQKLQPLVSAGLLQFSRRHLTLLEQLRQFPFAAHDDGPDALEMAVALATRRALFESIPRGRFNV